LGFTDRCYAYFDVAWYAKLHNEEAQRGAITSAWPRSENFNVAWIWSLPAS
jgi:hypothetical protein